MAKTQKTQTLKTTRKTLDVRVWRVKVVDAMEAGQRAASTMLDTMEALVLARFGPCKMEKPPKELNDDGTRADVGGPTKAQYDEDQKLFSDLAKARGLKSNQWTRKPYAQAVKTIYGTLPIEESSEALRKRLERKAQGAKTGHVGRTAGETQAKKASVAEQIEQSVTSWGIPATLEAVARILDEKKETALAAKTMRAIAGEMKGGAPVKVVTDARKAA